MSAQCRHFVQNAWKKELCSNCFKPREEHLESSDTSKPLIKTPHSAFNSNHKVQGILRIREHCQVRLKKRNVGFQESLVEVIGFGGDDFSDADDDSQDLDSNDSSSPEDNIPDSEEERALGNLTRANTNFNTVTANLTESAAPAVNTPKTFASLMLGKVQKDADGKKKTLLVSVTPFGGDDTLPTAKRPSDKKINNEYSRPKTLDIIPKNEKTEVTVKSIKKLVENDNPILEKRPTESPSLEKIVDMPLITSANLVSVIQNENLETPPTIQKTDKKITIARTPAIKKSENEKPRISLQNSTNNKGEYAITKITKRTDIMNTENRLNGVYNSGSEFRSNSGIELTLSPLKKETIDERSILPKGKEVNKISVTAAVEKKQELLEERKVEGEAVTKKFTFKESRESAGEPDGKADEDISEPPALPKNPPPLETKLKSCTFPTEPKCMLSIAEPRSSFLHGESKIKPAVPQKPVALPQKISNSPTSSFSTPSKKTLSTFAVSNNTPRVTEVKEQSPICNYSNSTSFPNGETNNNQSQLINNQQINRLPEVQPCQSPVQTSSEESPKPKKNLKNLTSPPRPKPPSIALCKPLQPEEDPDDDDNNSNSDSPFEATRASNKRRMAPKPPSSPIDDTPSSLFARNPTTTTKSDSPVVREMEKRERASSCSPKFRKAVSVSESPDPSDRAPEPAPRKNISLSQDSLANPERIEEKKKSRSRFSLKKFLRMGSRKDVDMTCGYGSRMDEIPSTPQPKPRLEIIHPLELDGAAVQVLGNEGNSRVSEDVTDFRSSLSLTNSSMTNGNLHGTVRPGKPPPPPRNQSLDDWSRLDPANKPARPPPPRTDAKLPPRGEKPSPKTWQSTSNSPSTSDSIYANLGEIRSSLVPSKPQRTASMREQTNSQPPVKKAVQNQNQDYENLESNSPASNSPASSESQVYECLSSSPECDSSLELRHGNGNHATAKRKSDSSALESNVEFKYHQPTFTRSTSLPYCGSETESELYAPYSFYTNDEGPEDDQDWKNKDDESRVSRLRQRRGRSIVHRSLEDNYGAVVVANHEALAQFLEHLNLASPLSLGLRGLKNANLRFSDFTLDSASSITVGKRIFYSATWNDQNVTICIAFNPTMHVSRKDFYLAPIVEFIDAVPKEISEKMGYTGRKTIEATISVLPRLQVNTIHTFGAMTKDTIDEGTTKDSFFVLLQFVNALKNLQARGIEESPKNLSNVVLCREDKDACYRIYLLQGLNVDSGEECEEKMASLCQCALLALQELHLTNKLPLVRELLTKEKAETLSQVKSLLEFSLWGPADVTLGGPRERETALQRWLDLERATVLHALVRTRAPLTVTDEYHLFFLVHTTSKTMCEASIHLDKQRNGLMRTN
ncbi:uncharacterized protein LOC122500505 isoform X2 [Leptopilina heterotoma]|uniref:uncharacterized protein LOC122500505 isoform X2 n=1 Tax=Leptopilina heterotoma TaxID=63436 RepID=UPI001CA80FC6|nr:uncharacterized protein LOC122500505 isoform X2 [Leptopilina heterotoma]